MEEMFTRIVKDVLGRLDGPLHFRFFLQPLMAIIFATRDVLKDAREGRPAYLWALFTEPALRGDLLRTGWKSISKVFILAVVLDFIYQLIVHRSFYPFETLLVAVLLAVIPYVLVRGPISRITALHKRVVSHEPVVTTASMNRGPNQRKN